MGLWDVEDLGHDSACDVRRWVVLKLRSHMLSLTASDFSGCYKENCVRKFWKQAELQR